VGNCFREPNKVYPGNDLQPYITVQSEQECCDRCKAMPNCNGWSFASSTNGVTVANFCALKSKLENGYADPRWVSGYSSAASLACKTAPAYVAVNCTSFNICKFDANGAIQAQFVQCQPGLQFSPALATCAETTVVKCS
jgi:hypothetical protein